MTTKQPRQQKTPQQRAEEALGVAQRKRDRLVTEALRLHKKAKALDTQLAEAEARLDYASKDPALPKSTSTATASTTNQAGDTA